MRWHPGVAGEGVADGGEGVAAVAAGGGEVGADAAVALQGGQGAPAAADLRGELVAADGVLGSVVRGRDVEAVRGSPDLGGFALEAPGEDESGVFSLVPWPGQVHRDPHRDGLVVAVAQPGQQDRVQAGLAGVPGGPDGGSGLAEGVRASRLQTWDVGSIA